ncbi:hypothetical protein [uncultured Fibrobacter sp.]|uniref:hypothetical protein n=1 Tax=uncultured Fibrobacter sp. TaxID=261512 RepID=UPI0025F027BA|nr:hypothetical protein [uncultured Fibrobacter sp.]
MFTEICTHSCPEDSIDFDISSIHVENIMKDKCNDPNVGFALSKNESSVKCYMGDTARQILRFFL